MNRIKVLQFICPTGLFGAERWVLALAKNYVGHHFIDCQLAVTHEHAGQNIEIYNKFKELGLKGHKIKSRSRFDINTVFKLVKLIRNEGIGIVQTHGYKSDIIGILAAKLSGIKAVAVPHGFDDTNDLKLRIFMSIGCFALRFFDRVAPLSEALQNDMNRIKVNRSRNRLILNGVDLDEIEKEGKKKTNSKYANLQNEKIIGYVGQINYGKNIGTLLRTFNLMYQEHKNIRLIIIGEGPLRPELELKSKRLSSGSRIDFLGYRGDRLSFLKEMDLFSMTSSREGIPRCMMEAMAMGIPVAAFRIPGIDKLIIPGKTGLLADFGDVQMLKSCWQKILFDNKLAEKLSKNARKHIFKKFSAMRMANEYLSLYQELLHNN